MTSGGDFDYKIFRQDWDNLLERQKYKEAEKLCHEGLAKSPLDQSRGRLYNHLGYLYENFLDDKTFDDILEHYVLSLQVDESNANSHYNLANFLLEQGMQHLLRALELNPNHAKANKRYANLTPIKANTTLDLGGHKYQVIEVVEDGVRAVRLRKRNDGGYERSDDEPVYVEVSAPEKVVYPSSNKKGKGRTGNMNNNAVQPLNIDDPNAAGYGQGDSSENNKNGSERDCCYSCVFYWWFWCLLWLVALGGIAVPVLAYFEMFGSDQCTTKITTNTIALNTDTATQGSLNILFVVNCDANDWDKQFLAANTLLQSLTSLTVNYEIMQYCNIGSNGMYFGNESLGFEQYTANTEITASNTGIMQETPMDGSNNYIAGALDACRDSYGDIDGSDSTPFLCVAYVSFEFMDAFDAMTVSSDTSFGKIYLTFMVDETDTDYTDGLYPVLGSFATATQCINEVENDYSYGNTWWDKKFNCDSHTNQHQYCPHCINYGVADELECASIELQSVFAGQGVTETKVETDGDEQVCTHQYEQIFFYCLGGVVPLLVWVLIVICVLCCRACRNRNRSKMEEQHQINDNKQTAFV